MKYVLFFLKFFFILIIFIFFFMTGFCNFSASWNSLLIRLELVIFCSICYICVQYASLPVVFCWVFVCRRGLCRFGHLLTLNVCRIRPGMKCTHTLTHLTHSTCLIAKHPLSAGGGQGDTLAQWISDWEQIWHLWPRLTLQPPALWPPVSHIKHIYPTLL